MDGLEDDVLDAIKKSVRSAMEEALKYGTSFSEVISGHNYVVQVSPTGEKTLIKEIPMPTTYPEGSKFMIRDKVTEEEAGKMLDDFLRAQYSVFQLKDGPFKGAYESAKIELQGQRENIIKLMVSGAG